MIYYLYGAPASGKTTLGRRLAAALGVDFVDLDAQIVKQTGKSIPEIFELDGEGLFRTLEKSVLAVTTADLIMKKKPAVVALGGGSLLDDDSRKLCESSGVVLCLETPSDEELARRIGAAAGTRPLGNKAKERAAHYASFPHRIAAWFDLENSLVLVGKNYAPSFAAAHHCVIDENVLKLHSSSLLPPPSSIHPLPSGEAHKTIETVASLWSAFAKNGLGRRDTVVAIGGGVTGDLTGFAAATWMRGIDWINIPTTLLSMVDASTGGKTGCDLPEGKNLVGAFHAPKLVAIDTDFLNTLPPEILRQGRAEMIKHEIIGLESSEGLEIARSLAVKITIVKEDPFELTGRRMLLNCGHTIGHAVEKLSNYTLSHGECVAIGCVEEARLAVRRGLAPQAWPDELAARFAAEGLPTAIPVDFDWEQIVETMKGDKKRDGNVVTFALPCGWGDVRAVPIDLDEELPFS